MKKFLSCCFLLLITLSSNAQDVDSLTYQLQRKKVNSLLTQRNQQFGQYTSSLEKRTGIFGLQTKKDIRHSNEILIAMVKTDDHIFKELKILLDYRISQQDRVQTQSKESESRNLAYMNTINKLRDQIDLLKKEHEELGKRYEKRQYLFIAIIVLMVASIFVIISRKGIKKT